MALFRKKASAATAEPADLESVTKKYEREYTNRI